MTLTFVDFGALKHVSTSFSLNLFLYNPGLGEGMADKSSFHALRVCMLMLICTSLHETKLARVRTILYG